LWIDLQTAASIAEPAVTDIVAQLHFGRNVCAGFS
jgi:hypothetical protein